MATPFRWPEGRCCAISLTYDDALPIHYEYVGRRLEAHSFCGTFYLKIVGDPMKNPERWRELAARGHELGNHTLFHPCRRCPASKHPWLDPAFDLRDYSPLRLQLELRVANAYLHMLDGKNQRTYAATCFDTHIGRRWNKRPISDLIRGDFVAARGGRTDQPVLVSESLDLLNLGSTLADGLSLEQLQEKIRAVSHQGGWLICVMHRIGSETHGPFLEPEVHEKFLGWLENQHHVWVRPLIEVAKWVRDWQSEAVSGERLA